MSEKRQQYKSALSKYLPNEYLDYVVDILIAHPVVFKISKPRKTKLGDFRANPKGKMHQITVNGDLNQYAFLITTLHEFAHLITYKDHKWKVKPHGEEWKSNYSRLVVPIIDQGHLPEELNKALINSLINVKASSCSDKNLHRILLKFDELEHGYNYLEQLDHSTTFELNGRTFTKGNLRRTRYVCMEYSTQKIYLVNALAKVKEVNNEK